MSPSSGSFLISAVTIRKGKPYKWHTLRLPCRNAGPTCTEWIFCVYITALCRPLKRIKEKPPRTRIHNLSTSGDELKLKKTSKNTGRYLRYHINDETSIVSYYYP